MRVVLIDRLQEMERFKVVEKETKTKAFSKEGMVAAPLYYVHMHRNTMSDQVSEQQPRLTLRSRKSLIRGRGSMTASTRLASR